MPKSGCHKCWRQKAFLRNPGLQKSLLTVTVAGVVIVVFTKWHIEMYKNRQWDKLKILRMFIGDVFLWNVSKQLYWRRVYQVHMAGR